MKKVELRKNTITNCGDIITKFVILEATENGTTKTTNGSLDGSVEWKEHDLRMDIYDIANCYIATGYKFYYVE